MTMSQLIQKNEYWAAIVGADQAHISSGGESICGIVFPRNNQKSSKQEGGLYRRRDPRKRKPWKRWLGIEEIPEEYELCGMCLNVRLGKNPEEETVEEIVDDILELGSIGGEGPLFTKCQLRQLRANLENKSNSEPSQRIGQPMGKELNKETRFVQNTGSGNAKCINLTQYASDTLDIQVGDEMVVKTYRNRIVVEPRDPDE